MKAKEIAIGGTYIVKVSGKLASVRIRGTFEYRSGQTYRDGWVGVNLATGREIRIRSSQKMRMEAGQ